ncbi:MAG: M28 family peptidase [Anaerolineae bacterium]|nr:MAG: M28 family peptidase [Anaerolineae bacterium]
MKVEQAIKADLSVDKAYQHMTFLVKEVGERLAGTESIAEAADYIRAELERCGLEAKIDRFPMYHSYPVSAALRVTYPEDRVIETLPSCHILSTLDEGLAGELVYLGAGGYEDYESVDAKDKIVLVDMTWAPPRPEKARIALEKGAKAVIILNWGTPDNPTIQRGAIKSVWGNPTPESFQQIPHIPVVNVTRAAGEYLKALCSQGRVVVWLRADATREWVLANQPVGVLRGRGKSEEFVLVGGHLEGWGKTAICNSSGNALTLELARVLARHRNKLDRGVVFAFWDGHEIAEAAGSTYFVDTLWDELAGRCVAYVNVDNPGILGTSVPNSRSAPEIKGFLLEAIEEVWGQPGHWKMPYKGGDQSFFGVGVPYISFATGYTPEELERLNWASLSPWLHTEADTLDKVDRALFEKHLHFFAALTLRLCNARLMPYDLSAPAGVLKAHLQALKEMSADLDFVELHSLVSRAEELERAIQRFDACKAQVSSNSTPEGEEIVRLINGASVKASRALSVLWTEAGRYEQDPYGYHLIGQPIPRLYVPIVQMKRLAPDDEALNLWITKFTRERNRVSDIIGSATQSLASTVRFLEKF